MCHAWPPVAVFPECCTGTMRCRTIAAGEGSFTYAVNTPWLSPAAPAGRIRAGKKRGLEGFRNVLLGTVAFFLSFLV